MSRLHPCPVLVRVLRARPSLLDLHVGWVCSELLLDLHLEISHVRDVVVHQARALIQAERTYILGAQVRLGHLTRSISRRFVRFHVHLALMASVVKRLLIGKRLASSIRMWWAYCFEILIVLIS